MSGRSRVAAEVDSFVLATRSSMSGCATSQRLSEARYAQPSVSTGGGSEKRRPSERTWPSFSSVSRMRRAVARLMPVRPATSESVSAGRSWEKTWSPAIPRSSDCSDWVSATAGLTRELYSARTIEYIHPAHTCVRSEHMGDATIMPLADALAANLKDGDTVALEGFPHLIPFAAGHEIVRQERRDLVLVRMTPDLIYDQLIGMGCARRLVFSYGGNPGVGSLHRFRDAVENGWPRPLELEEHSHAGLATAYAAGAANLPFGVLRGYAGTDLAAANASVAFVDCPFTGQRVSAVRAVQPDLTVIHAQHADRRGNVMLWGIAGVQKEAVLAARRAIVTVEEIVDELEPRPSGVVLPSWVLTTVCVVPNGAWPAYAAGYSVRDNAFYAEWESISRDRDRFLGWMRANVLDAVRVAS